MSKLLLVRHGDTELNSRERFWGRTDVKLSADGIRQAERLRDRLAAEKIDATYSSDLSRASATAKIIASRHQVDVTACSELREINFGELEGLKFEEFSQLYPQLVRLWVERNPALKYPGGESLDEFIKRASKFLSRLEKHTAEETVLIVAHSGPLRLLICQLLCLDLKHWWQIRLALASLTVIETYSQGAILSLLNDVCHLAERS